MIYTGLNRTGEIETVKANGGADVAEVYGGINYQNPIFYSQKTLTGTSPLTFKGLGQPLTDYLISGNTVQDGIPTPDMPVDVVGCGVRTGNILDATTYGELSRSVVYLSMPVAIPIVTLTSPEGLYTRVVWLKSTDPMTRINVSNWIPPENSSTFNLALYSDADYFRIEFRNAAYSVLTDEDIALRFNIMLNSGSTPLPYAPYGYKLPLTINSTEYPIYLGQVDSTRRIKKLVLTGDENIESKSGNAGWYIPIADMKTPVSVTAIEWYCSHYQAVANNVPWVSYDYMISWSTADTGPSNGLRIRDVNFLTGVTVADFKSYLAAQYVDGTPVTIWYVLDEPETGIVNEPLHKIGDYADTISMAQASVTIPTTAGTNTLTVGTTVQPSSVSITGHLKSSSLYGNLTDVNGVNILDKAGVQIKVHGQ